MEREVEEVGGGLLLVLRRTHRRIRADPKGAGHLPDHKPVRLFAGNDPE